jgi:hypothetical protein
VGLIAIWLRRAELEQTLATILITDSSALPKKLRGCSRGQFFIRVFSAALAGHIDQ